MAIQSVDPRTRALVALADAVAEIVEAGGELGVPGGTLYAALMTHGCTLEQLPRVGLESRTRGPDARAGGDAQGGAARRPVREEGVMNRMIGLALALALAGCASQEQRLQQAAEMSAVDDAKCAGMGGDAYASCRLALVNARAADEALTKAAIAGVVASTVIGATGRR